MVINWFKSIEQKSKCFFIQFDVIEFYPSITEKILEDVIVFAKEHMEMQKMTSELLNIAGKPLSITKMKHEKRKNQRAALMLRWEATTALKSVSLLEFIFYRSFQILYHEKTVAYTGMMV